MYKNFLTVVERTGSVKRDHEIVDTTSVAIAGVLIHFLSFLRQQIDIVTYRCFFERSPAPADRSSAAYRIAMKTLSLLIVMALVAVLPTTSAMVDRYGALSSCYQYCAEQKEIEKRVCEVLCEDNVTVGTDSRLVRIFGPWMI